MEDTTQITYVTLADGIIASDFALKNLNAALGKAQIKFSPAVKDLENKYGGYKYVPLENIISSSRPALSDNHLTVMQFPSANLESKTVTLVTRVSHWDSGEWVQNTLEIPGELALGKDGAAKFNQQTIGGGVTYARKIAYKPILGVSDSDDDIDAGQEQPNMDSRPKTRQAENERKIQEQAQSQEAEERVKWLDLIAPTSPEQFLHDVAHLIAKDARSFVGCADKNLLAAVFNRLEHADQFSSVLVPLQKTAFEIERKPFIQAVAAEAKSRGYKVNRTTGTYEEGKPKDADPRMDPNRYSDFGEAEVSR